jgi:hypothetical protein
VSARYADAERIDRMAVESLREERRTMRAKLVYALGELARMVEYRSPEKACRSTKRRCAAL